MDLPKKNLGIQIDNNFEPNYEISIDKRKIVDDLLKRSKKSSVVWLATDEDREGEAISWHLFETLNLKKENTKRIAFHEITKKAITHAIENPREINIDLVFAQQARRILDRIVGFKLSPVLWKKVKSGLSAGRVQSVAVRLIAEREKEIKSFQKAEYFNAQATFLNQEGVRINAQLNKDIDKLSDLKSFLENHKLTQFSIDSVEKKPSKKKPSPPFITSSLQQVASTKFGYSVSKTMMLAQRLYESGKITYMRTDSTNISEEAKSGIKKFVLENFGEKYFFSRSFSKKAKNAQEAHEAIRPTNMQLSELDGDEGKLYNLIWRRTIASQMAEALSEITTIKISGENVQDKSNFFVCKGEVIKFKGFLEIDPIDKKNSDIIPVLSEGEKLNLEFILARQKFKKPRGRYNEASLVKKLEELGIGRPSTYAPTISTIQKRGYVDKKIKEGAERTYNQLILQTAEINVIEKTEITGREKNKLSPTDIGTVVTHFLQDNFEQIMDYQFTATIENKFDHIAKGDVEWKDMLSDFYTPFHSGVEETLENSERATGERHLGEHPESGKKIIVRIGKFGPMVQVGDEKIDGEKPKFASLLDNQSISSITLEEALELFKLPRILGEFEGKEVKVNIGRFGPYVQVERTFASIPREIDPMEINLEEAIALHVEKVKQAEANKIKSFPEDPDLFILNGKYGPYIKKGKKNFKIPKGKVPEELELEECLEIIENQPKKTREKRKASK